MTTPPSRRPNDDDKGNVHNNKNDNVQKSPSNSSLEADVVIVDWEDVVASAPSANNNMSRSLEEAFGRNGAGLIAIRNVPGFLQAKKAFLPLAHALVNLPADYLEKELADEKSLYNAGWSHGKEKLGSNKQPDTAKGSFYYNPVSDTPGTPQEREMYPLSYPCNIWPNDDDDDDTTTTMIPGFRQKAITLGRILHQAVVALSKHVDALAQDKLPPGNNYNANLLYNAMKDTDKVKARLLYYFPIQQQQEQHDNNREDSWIGWHNDSGFLTALAGDLYVNHTTGQVLDHQLHFEDDDDNDMTAAAAAAAASASSNKPGLYVVNRQDQVLHVTLPFDCMAVQIGECTQIVTGGAVTATPHCVRGIIHKNNDDDDDDTISIARISLPCFVDAPPSFALQAPSCCTRQDVLDATMHSRRVPPLAERWTENGMAFGDFLQKTFSMYYDWTNTQEQQDE